MKNEIIELDRIYGLDGQYIYFKPNCEVEIEEGDIIVNLYKDIEMHCVGKDTFILSRMKKRDFVRGYDLFLQYKKLIA